MDCSRCMAKECHGKDEHGHCDDCETVEDITDILKTVFDAYDTLLSPYVANGQKPLDYFGFNYARNMLREDFKRKLEGVNERILGIAREAAN